MRLSSKEFARALYQSLLDTPGKEKEISEEFLKFCAEKNLLSLLPAVIKHLEVLHARAADKDKIKLTVGHDLQKSVVDNIKDFIEADVGTGLKPVRTDIVEDESMLGGFRAEYQHKIYDGSVKMQLARARGKMLNDS